MSDSEEDDRSGSGSEEEEEEQDESGSGEGSGSDEEGSGSGSGSGSDDESGSGSGSDSDDSDKKKKKKGDKGKEKDKSKVEEEKALPVFKPTGYQSIMSTLKDINKDLDEITINVEKVHNKFSPLKPKYTSTFTKERENKPPPPTYPRNYHPPLHEQERRRSYSPKKYDNYQGDDDYDPDHLNDRDDNYYENRQDEYPSRGNNNYRSSGGPGPNQSYHSRGQGNQSQGAYNTFDNRQMSNSRGQSERNQQQSSFQNTNRYPPSQGYNNQQYPSQKQVGFQNQSFNQSYTQPNLQRNISPASRFINNPSTNYNNQNLFVGGQPPMTSYTQFYRNQSALQNTLMYPQQQQNQGYLQAQSNPQMLGSSNIMGVNSTPQFGQFNYGNPQQNSQSFSQQSRKFDNNTLTNPVAREGEVQRVENLQEAIDALLR
ncbi:UNKNOWN [Stylonychia lemnae]|uniref:Uncharacterized protein n=1 Tax=Stylonychia lemnae TaxID=5949 RepID=A0A077ZMH8_STYLE|nr:UNKNOWN [Stylonychia lemnae]|eukprot:CDW71177.1 UNKNOWN [Stylonychia lemnae]